MDRLLEILEIIGAITGLLYIIQVSRLRRNCWIYGGISTFIFAFICYYSKLYVDGSLNVYYVLMAFVGWFTWAKRSDEKRVSRMEKLPFIASLLFTVCITGIISFLASNFTDSDFPILDSTVGAFSITATWLTTRKKIENWIFWIIANAIATILFLYKDLYYYSALMAVYFIFSIVGLVEWKKQFKYA